MFKSKPLAVVASVVALAMTLAACSSSGGQSSAGSGDGKTLHVIVASLPQYLGNPFQAVNPPRAEVTSAVFDGLTRVSKSGELEGWLATSWDRLNDTTWQFKLREGVEFSNGEPFNADSVVATVTHLVGEDGTGTFMRNGLPTLASATKVDEHTVNLVTKAPSGVLPLQVAALDVIPPKYYEKVGIDGFTKAPIGTGPYKVDSISTTQWNLTANTTSWRKPKIGKVQITQSLDLSARTNALRSGQADIIVQGDMDQIDALESAGFKAHPLQNQGVLVIQFINTSGKASPLDKRDVRLAMNYAIDRKTLDETIFKGLAGPANQALSPGTIGFNADLPAYPYDPAKAKQLLADAGYGDGLSLKAVVSIGQFLGDSAIFQSVKSQLAEVGVKLTINQETTANMTSYLLKGSWPAQVFSTAYLPQPTMDASKGYFTNSCLKSPGSWCDKDQAALITKITTQTVGSPEREQSLKELSTMVHDNPGGLFLFNLLRLAYTAKNVGGYSQDPATNILWENITLK
jgi:peptide/nickel transport system substrate-binding protein